MHRTEYISTFHSKSVNTRPYNKNMRAATIQWFKHDSNANMDAKLKKVRIKYGMEGYGLYWYCLELIAGDVSVSNINFELEHDSEIIAHDTGIHVDRINEMMAYLCDLGLFEIDNGTVTCLKLAKRLDQSMTSNPQMRKIIKGFNDNHDGIMTESCPEETRLDKIDKNKDTSSPTVSDPVPFAKIIDLYHRLLPNNPSIASLSTTRKSQIKARWKNDIPDIEAWERYFTHVAKSRFLTGKAEPAQGRKVFVANIDFLIKENNMLKIIEGNYND